MDDLMANGYKFVLENGTAKLFFFLGRGVD
jgi:hypothetical protein